MLNENVGYRGTATARNARRKCWKATGMTERGRKKQEDALAHCCLQSQRNVENDSALTVNIQKCLEFPGKIFLDKGCQGT